MAASHFPAHSRGVRCEETEIPTDFAWKEKGFFAVRGVDGQQHITPRQPVNFSWSQDLNGNTILATSEGLPVSDSRGNTIRVPRGVSSGKHGIFEQWKRLAISMQPECSGIKPVFWNKQFNNPRTGMRINSCYHLELREIPKGWNLCWRWTNDIRDTLEAPYVYC